MSREFNTYKNENGAIVSAHVVTEDSQGPVQVVDGTGQTATVGTVLVTTSRPDVYDIVDAKSFAENYSQDRSVTHSHGTFGEHTHSNDTESHDDESEYDPSTHSVADVKSYLSTVRGTEEYARVVNAERAGKGRSIG